jgi:outer membrane lipoprotein-sorting protein
MERRVFFGTLLGLAVGGPLRAAEVDAAPVRGWIGRARSLKSVAAEFRQERHLRAVTRPLVSSGRVWYRADGALRWQLGEPPKLIALRPSSGADVTVIEPEAKTVRSFSAAEAGVKGGALALLDAGFPESHEAFEKRFRLDAVERDDAGAWRVTTQLRDNALAVAVQRMVFVVEESSSQLRGLEVWLRDGSKIISQFSQMTENGPVPDSLFQEVTDGYRELK